MNSEHALSNERLGFLTEMMNVGAGNAATAFSLMLHCRVEVAIPAVHIVPIAEVPSVVGDPSLPVVCVRMRMLGDVTGHLFFIVPNEHKTTLAHLAERAALGSEADSAEGDLSALTEIGNITAGVYLTAIHDFCKLNIYHTVPAPATDMAQALIDEPLAGLSRIADTVIVIENEFLFEEYCVKALFLIIPSLDCVNVLTDSIEQARQQCTTK